MPRYFFHIRDGSEYPDDEGVVLRDIDAAKEEAIRYAGEILQSEPKRFWTGEEWQMTVVNDAGLTLFTLMFLATDAPSIARRVED